MKAAHHRTRTGLWSLVILMVAWVLAACGPGVGGSGTGADEDPLKSFGATAVSACGNPLAPQLAACIQGQTVRYADNPAQARVTAEVQDSRITLQAPCADLKFSGEWAVIGDQPPRFYGTATRATGTVLATLIASAAGPASLQIEVRDQLDQPLLGPLTLVLSEAGAVIASCS